MRNQLVEPKIELRLIIYIFNKLFDIIINIYARENVN